VEFITNPSLLHIHIHLHIFFLRRQTQCAGVLERKRVSSQYDGTNRTAGVIILEPQMFQRSPQTTSEDFQVAQSYLELAVQ
jgi:hypothetical protein